MTVDQENKKESAHHELYALFKKLLNMPDTEIKSNGISLAEAKRKSKDVIVKE